MQHSNIPLTKTSLGLLAGFYANLEANYEKIQGELAHEHISLHNSLHCLPEATKATQEAKVDEITEEADNQEEVETATATAPAATATAPAPAATATAPAATATAKVDLDPRGFPHDTRIHSGGKTTVKSKGGRYSHPGQWKYKGGVAPEIIDQIEQELKALGYGVIPDTVIPAPEDNSQATTQRRTALELTLKLTKLKGEGKITDGEIQHYNNHILHEGATLGEICKTDEAVAQWWGVLDQIGLA